ncbi:Mov34/MPN/PAD-1 family protein [Cytobacillus horneckiae]|uniref:Mov34/MPN/PAD-1 family protein n=1 Tax=Cytobacillus horneckiae TaxID=549687 RepID=UPI003D23B223
MNLITNEFVYVLPNNKTLFIRPEAIEKMLKYRQDKSFSLEAGGILIGRILLENEHYIIDDVSEPMSTDKRSRFRFSRKPVGHQEYFNSIWERENRCCFYLGEWHTHPEFVPIPSYVDRMDWDRLLRLNFENDTLFFIIVGIKKIKVWYGNLDNKKIIELKRRNFVGEKR